MDIKDNLTFGVKLVLNTWDTLRLAITMGFSGKDTDEMLLDNLLNDILDNVLLHRLHPCYLSLNHKFYFHLCISYLFVRC